MEEEKTVSIEMIIKQMKKNKKKPNTNLILKAYNYAKEHHGDQCRKSGEPYIIHPLNVAYILTSLELDDETICAALLHDVVEDTEVTRQDIIDEFGNSIAEMVDGVTKLRKNSIYNSRRRAN